MPFVLAFVVVGVVELAVFAAVWDAIGPAWTIGLALMTGIVGSAWSGAKAWASSGKCRQHCGWGGFPAVSSSMER